MNFYICVYLQKIPDKKDWVRAKGNASGDPVLKEYVRRYENRFKKNKDGIGRFYDWGDDPAFFAAEKFGGNVTWGVCRHDVRDKLKKEDVVVFFCAQEQENQKPKKWKYYYVGLGTVGEVVKPRERLWKKVRYQEYTKYYNLLIDQEGCHREPIDDHEDWADRLAAQYIIFDKDPGTTHFNVTNPLLVATYGKGDDPWKEKILEHWKLSNKHVQRIYNLVPKRGEGRKLRTSSIRFGHVFINLRKILKQRNKRLSDEQLNGALEKMRRAFLAVSKEVAEE